MSRGDAIFDPDGRDYSFFVEAEDPVPHTRREVWNHWIQEWRERPAAERDNMIVIDGPTGEGKSALGYRIARALDPTFDHTRVVYSAAEVLELWGKLPPRSVVLYDESVRGLLSRNFRKDDNTSLVQMGFTARKLLLTLILCIPDFMQLDIAYREVLTKYRLTVQERGEAKVHVRSERIRYDPRDRRRHYVETEWNPLTWTDPSGEREWEAIYTRSRDLTRKFASDLARQLRAAEELGNPEAKLRERQARQEKQTQRGEVRDRILARLGEGLTHDEVATLEKVSSRTVDRVAAQARASGPLGEA